LGKREGLSFVYDNFTNPQISENFGGGMGDESGDFYHSPALEKSRTISLVLA